MEMVGRRPGTIGGLTACAVLALTLALTGCGGGSKNYQSSGNDRDPSASSGGLFGSGSNLFSGDAKKGSEGAVAVNAFLWRASLDTLAFLPLASADPFGGVIITDWYSPPETPEERFKVNVYILGRVLRADGLKISVFRQTRDTAGRWNDATVGPEVPVEFENAVLSQARELRLRAVAQN
jgi:hypothetical protein